MVTMMVQKYAFKFMLGVVATLLIVAPGHAQVTDPRVVTLEEQLRQLTGRIEELNFQMLQMQDQMRRMQEDNEFRLQQLEDQQSGSLSPSAPPTTDLAQAPKADRLDNTAAQITSDLNQQQTTGAPPRSLGSIRVDANGNIIDSNIDFSAQGVGSAIDGAQVSSVTLTGSPDEIYATGYRHVLDGDYGLAEAVFASFIATYPSDPLVADAKFWLGESILSQGRFEDAAEVFIDARSQHPNADKAPETMLKIGTIMAGLGNRDVACATFDDALTNFGSMSVKTRNAITAERQKARC